MRLTRRQLNRATLARQGLLSRQPLDVVVAVERLGGLQAQEPATPYLALWTRLHGFKADDLDRALRERRLIKATLGRSTLHLVSAADYRATITALQTVRRTKWMSEQRGRPIVRDLPALAEDSLRYAAVPRTNIEMRDHAGTLGEPLRADELWRRIRRFGAFVHVPGAEAWSFGRRPSLVAARSWLEGEMADEGAGLEHLVRRHLRAFGPARLADIAQWSGLTVTRLRRGLARIAEIIRYEDEDGRDLFDLAGAPLPDADTAAPARLLPMWDETLLAYADRSRVLPEPYRKRVIVKAGDVLPTFTIDGFVAGLWWPEPDQRDMPAITFEPFAPISESDREALESEGGRLTSFIFAREPNVYSRYRHTRRRT